MSTPLESAVENLFIGAIGTVGGMTAQHYAEDDEQPVDCISVQAIEGEQLNEGCNPTEVEVIVRLRTLSTVAAAIEETNWNAIEAKVNAMATVAPGTGVFRWTMFRYSKAKTERPAGNNFRHRQRHIPMQAKLA